MEDHQRNSKKTTLFNCRYNKQLLAKLQQNSWGIRLTGSSYNLQQVPIKIAQQVVDWNRPRNQETRSPTNRSR